MYLVTSSLCTLWPATSMWPQTFTIQYKPPHVNPSLLLVITQLPVCTLQLLRSLTLGTYEKCLQIVIQPKKLPFSNWPKWLLTKLSVPLGYLFMTFLQHVCYQINYFSWKAKIFVYWSDHKNYVVLNSLEIQMESWCSHCIAEKDTASCWPYQISVQNTWVISQRS